MNRKNEWACSTMKTIRGALISGPPPKRLGPRGAWATFLTKGMVCNSHEEESTEVFHRVCSFACMWRTKMYLHVSTNSVVDGSFDRKPQAETFLCDALIVDPCKYLYCHCCRVIVKQDRKTSARKWKCLERFIAFGIVLSTRVRAHPAA